MLLNIFEDILNRFNDEDDHVFLEAFLAEMGTIHMDITKIENWDVDAHDDLDGRMECEDHHEDDMEAETENHANARNDIANNYNDVNCYLDRW